MRKVIKGKLYDTGKAREVGYWSNGWGGSDYRSRTLYRKRTGEYFLLEQFGEYESRESIVPLAYDEARTWGEQHLETDDYEAEFGLPGEGAEHDLHVIISEAAWQAISRNACTDGITIREEIERMATKL